MDFSTYQKLTEATAIYGKEVALVYTTMGLASEAGEVAGKVKKAIRDDGGVISDKRREDLSKEIGDVLWYCARLAAELGIDLGDIAEENIAKLSQRKASGTIGGDGDNR